MKVGLLPFYLRLYDEVAPERRPVIQAFADVIGRQLRRRGLLVEQAPICCVKKEFAAALRALEDHQVEALITLHLAYSPSLEAAEVISGSALPLIVLDTTPDFEFDFAFGKKVMTNHGIHGVQDFCNLMLRLNKRFLISAGHWEKSSVLDRVVQQVKAAVMAKRLQTLRVGRIGGHFPGMGDFQFPADSLSLTVVDYELSQIPRREPDEDAINGEHAADRKRFVFGDVNAESYRRTLRACLRLRSWLDDEKLDAFTLCFRGITRASGWETVPFLEASKSMARGIAYAGEGDVLTAALLAVLMRHFPDTSFTEMFCPDWAHERIFVSHMGEINTALCEHMPILTERPYIFSDTGNPVLATGCFRAGQAALINLAPGKDGAFKLIAAPVTVEAPKTPSALSITGWFAPECGDVADFLEAYSRLGGTHHLCLCYGYDLSLLANFAYLMGWHYHELRPNFETNIRSAPSAWQHGEWS